MTWRETTDVKDRIFAALPYLLPLFYALPFGKFLLTQFEFLQILYFLLAPVFFIYGILGPFSGIIIFFVLFLAVVRNERISHFIRFNTMQAILIDILVVLVSLVMGMVLEPILGATSLLTETLYNVVFLGVFAACGYSIVQSFLGRYAEIPGFSEAVYTQVR